MPCQASRIITGSGLVALQRYFSHSGGLLGILNLWGFESAGVFSKCLTFAFNVGFEAILSDSDTTLGGVGYLRSNGHGSCLKRGLCAVMVC